MENSDLFKKLDRLNPTEEQLKTYMELRKGIFPLPLYVRDSKGNYRIVRRLKDGVTVEGIVTERGIYLKTPIYPSTFANEHTTVEDLLAEAKKVHPDARLLTSDDVMGCGKDVIVEILDESSPMRLTLHKLDEQGIKFFEDFPSFVTLPNNKYDNFHLLEHNIGCDTEEILPMYVNRMYLFVPKEKMTRTSPQEGLGLDGDNFPAPSQAPAKATTPAKTKEHPDRFPLSLFLRNDKGQYFIANKLHDGRTVEGIVLQDTIILRQVIHPSKINKAEPTVQDLENLAKKVHPEAVPLYYNGFWGGGVMTLLLIDRKRYNRTAEILRKYGVFMPDINKSISFIGGGYIVASNEKNATTVNDIRVNWWRGNSRIKYVDEMILAIPRPKVDPLYT